MAWGDYVQTTAVAAVEIPVTPPHEATVDCAFPGAVTAGNSILVFGINYSDDGDNQLHDFADDLGNLYTVIFHTTGGFFVALATNINGGSNTVHITGQLGVGTTHYITAKAVE